MKVPEAPWKGTVGPDAGTTVPGEVAPTVAEVLERKTTIENHTALFIQWNTPFKAVLNHIKAKEMSADKPVKRAAHHTLLST